MTKDKEQMAERILDLTVEIICLLNGEEYAVKRLSERVTHGIGLRVPEGTYRIHIPNTVSPPHSLIHERHNEQKILDLTHQIFRLLTGEVPIRCEDVAVCFSMVELENAEGNKDLYKDVMMESRQISRSLGNGHDYWRNIYGKIDESHAEGLSLKTHTRGGIMGRYEPEGFDTPTSSQEPRIKDKLDKDKGETSLKLPKTRKKPSRTTKYVVVESNSGEKGTVKEINFYPSTGHTLTSSPSTPAKKALASCGNLASVEVYTEADYISTQIKEEFVSWEEGNVAHVDLYPPTERPQADYPPTDMKEESASCEEGTFRITEMYGLQNHPQTEYPSAPIKEESRRNPTDVERPPPTGHPLTEYLSTPIKEESSSLVGDFSDTVIYPLSEHPSPHVKEASTSFEEGTLTQVIVSTPPEHLAKIDPFHIYGEYVLGIDNAQRDVSKVFKCIECGKRFDNKYAYVSHQRKHTIERMYNCPSCQKYFNIYSDPVGPQTYGHKIACAVCKKPFSRKSNLFRHYRTHIGKEISSCPECKKKHTRKFIPRIHRKTPRPVKLYTCPHCGRCFNNRSYLSAHQRTHTGERPFSCSECGKCFSKKANLVRHQMIHTGQMKVSCDECGKCFPDKQRLVSHQSVHTGQKPFSCPECGKQFSSSSYLVIHQRIHTGEKPFACSECDKRFTHKSVLVIHQRIHTGEKPFACSECGKCFTDQSSLFTHRRVHTGEKPFACAKCGKYFTVKSSLVKHYLIHTGYKPFPCSACGKRFSSNAYLVRHQRIHKDL